VVPAAQQRAAATYLGERCAASQRRARQFLGRSRSSLRYHPKPRAGAAALVRALRRLARRQPRYGYRRLQARLVKLGWAVTASG